MLKRVVQFDRAKGHIEVEGGIEWPELIEYLTREQAGQPHAWAIREKQTGVDRVTLAGSLVSTVLRGFHASILGIAFGPVNTVFTGMGLLAVIGGIYARVSLRSMIGRPMPSSGEPSSGLTGAEGGTQQ